MRTLVAIAALTLAAPAIAAPNHVFTSEGVTYDYTVARQDDGSVLLTGTSHETHAPFALRVRDRRVSGTVGDAPVDFQVSRRTAADLVAEAGSTATVRTAAGQ